MKVKSESEAVQSCLTLSDHMDCSPPGSSIHGSFQARVLEWVAIAFSEMKPTDLLKRTKLHQIILIVEMAISSHGLSLVCALRDGVRKENRLSESHQEGSIPTL